MSRRSFADEYGQGNKIPAAMIDPVARAIANLYPTPSSHTSAGRFVPGTQTSNGILTGNYYYSVLNPNPFTKYFGRLDYDVTSHNRITLSDTQRDRKTLGVPGIYTCPIGCQDEDIDSNNAQISDVWNISPRLINEARFGFTSQLDFFKAPSLNADYPAKIGLQFAKANLFPFITIAGNNCCDAPQPGTNATYKQVVFDPSDVVTLIAGKHVLHFGGELLAYRQNGTAWGNINAAALQFSGAYTQSTVGDGSSGIGFADFLLGQAQSWSAAVKPEYGVRLKAPQMFAQDDFKVRPNLTINLGLRYQMQLGVSEVKNNISAFDPTVTNPATATKGALWYATTGANGRRDLIAPIYNTFLPRVGFSWLPQVKYDSPRRRWSLRLSVQPRSKRTRCRSGLCCAGQSAGSDKRNLARGCSVLKWSATSIYNAWKRPRRVRRSGLGLYGLSHTGRQEPTVEPRRST